VSTFKPLDVVTLRQTKEGLGAGALGTVLEVYASPRETCLVEFCNTEGETERVLELPAADLSKAT
jgi:hypothetical protein